jgi:cytoskeletal protein CcmA (bactofilin family)
VENIPAKVMESEVTLLGEGSIIKGNVVLDRMVRLHGRVEGKVIGLPGSTIIVAETGTIHGELEGDHIVIDGLVQGTVRASRRVTLTETCRLLGDVECPNLEIRFGAFFQGKALSKPKSEASATLSH